MVASVRARGVTIKASNLAFLTADFEALCHSQQDFQAEIEQLKALSLGPPLSVNPPTPEQVKDAGSTEIGARIDDKLGRALGPKALSGQIAARRDQYVNAHLHRENVPEESTIRKRIAPIWRAVRGSD